MSEDAAKTEPVQRVHNHRPWMPMCGERSVDGFLRGWCLNDDGSDRIEIGSEEAHTAP